MATKDEVVWAYRYLLGRDPENDAVITLHAALPDWVALRSAIMKSKEYNLWLEFYISQNELNRLGHKWVLAPVLGGQRKMWIDLGDCHVSRHCLADNFEPLETAFIREHLKAGDVFLDIGANIGWYTVLASTIVGERGFIFAFEPRPETAARLRQTIEDNPLKDRIVLHQCGLSDAQGVAYIKNKIDDDNPGGSAVSSRATWGIDSAQIALRTLNSFNFERIDVVKMDVEGSEMNVMRGAKQLFARLRPVVLTEILPAGLAQVSGATPDDFLRVFLDLNYEISMIGGPRNGETITSYPSDWPLPLMNVAMTPR